MSEDKPLVLTSKNFEEIIKGDKPVFVDFWAPWCGPCQIMLPIVDEIAKDYPQKDKIVIGTVNIDENPEIAAKFNVMSVPSLLFFNNGKVTNSLVGVTPKEEIEKNLDKLVK